MPLKNFSPKRSILLFLIMTSFALLAGCSSKSVALSYNTHGADLSPTSKHVHVSDFENKNTRPGIGVNSSGEVINSTPSSAEWVSKAMTDELVRHGVPATYGYGEASGYSLRGTINNLWLEQTGVGQYSAKVSITLILANAAGKTVLTQTFNTENNSIVMPRDKSLSDFMETTLRDVIEPAAGAVRAKL